MGKVPGDKFCCVQIENYCTEENQQLFLRFKLLFYTCMAYKKNLTSLPCTALASLPFYLSLSAIFKNIELIITNLTCTFLCSAKDIPAISSYPLQDMTSTFYDG